MTVASRQARLNAAVLSSTRGFGEVGIYTHGATGASVLMAITRRTDMVWSSGQIGVEEDHYTGYLLDTVTPPAEGDMLTAADGARYEIDQSPTVSNGLLKVCLRRRNA